MSDEEFDIDDATEDLEASEARRRKNFDQIGELLIVKIDFDYPIELSRIESQEKLLAWVEHLAKKKWMTKEGIRDFIKRVREIKGWKPILP